MRLPDIDYSRHPGFQYEPDPKRGLQAAESLEPLIAQMTEIEARRGAEFGYRYGFESEFGRTLADDGVLRLQLSHAAADDLVTTAAPAVAVVRERLRTLNAQNRQPSFSERMEMATAQAHAPLRSAVERAMREIGALELTSAYFCAKGAKLENAALLVSAPEDKESMLARTPEAPGAGLHVDSSGKCLIKAVLYLSDVDAGRGPFGIVPGSHRWNPGSLDRVRRRAFDRSGLKGRSPGSRRTFISMPKHLQVKAEFGADLLPEWEQTRELLASERLSLGGPGLVSLFDPEAVHRGGLAATAERRAILITLSALY